MCLIYKLHDWSSKKVLIENFLFAKAKLTRYTIKNKRI